MLTAYPETLPPSFTSLVGSFLSIPLNDWMFIQFITLSPDSLFFFTYWDVSLLLLFLLYCPAKTFSIIFQRVAIIFLFFELKEMVHLLLLSILVAYFLFMSLIKPRKFIFVSHLLKEMNVGFSFHFFFPNLCLLRWLYNLHLA